MLRIDIERCNGCGICRGVCPQHAITVNNGLASVNEKLCTQCGACADVCPAGAIRDIREATPVHMQSGKGGEKMVYGFGGRGLGRRGGAGFGFRGASPPWPYVGRGRGGLPRCAYAGVTMPVSFPATPPPYTPQMTREQELGWLKSQADAVKAELDRVEAKINDLKNSN